MGSPYSLNEWHARDAALLGNTGRMRRAADGAEQAGAVAVEAARVLVRPQRLAEQGRQRRAQPLVVVPEHLLVLLLVAADQLAVDLQRRVADLHKLPNNPNYTHSMKNSFRPPLSQFIKG